MRAPWKADVVMVLLAGALAVLSVGPASAATGDCDIGVFKTCYGFGRLVVKTDCDGDGKVDWTCTDVRNDERGALTSKKSCQHTWPADTGSSCRVGFFILPTPTSRCPDMPGYTAKPAMDIDGNDLRHIADGQQDVVVYSSMLAVVIAAREACEKDPKCAGFNSLGSLKSAITTKSTTTSPGNCLYTKTAPYPPPRECPVPRAGSTNWCPGDPIVYVTDCDGDGVNDVACTTGANVFAAAFSSKGCEPKRSDNDPSLCKRVLTAVSEVTEACPPMEGYHAYPNFEAGGAPAEFVTIWQPGMSYSDTQEVLDVVKQACVGEGWCVAFTSSGYLIQYMDKVTIRPSPGACLYISDAEVAKGGFTIPAVPAVASCSKPADNVMAGKNWCPSPYFLLNLDCDNDGGKDWACTSGGKFFATSLSKKGCVATRAKDGDTTVCPPAYNAVQPGATKCIDIPGYVAIPHTDIQTGSLTPISVWRGDEVFKSLDDMLGASGLLCEQEGGCLGFTSTGNLVYDNFTGATRRTGACLYIVHKPPQVTVACEDPSETALRINWCDGDYIKFNLDCDGDGLKDWACSSAMFGTYAATLSSRFCTTARLDMSSCARAFDATPGTGTPKCPEVIGYTARPNTDVVGSIVDYVTTWNPNDVYPSLDALVQATAQVCLEENGCVAFTSTGFLKRELTFTRTSEGVCLYVLNSP